MLPKESLLLCFLPAVYLTDSDIQATETVGYNRSMKIKLVENTVKINWRIIYFVPASPPQFFSFSFIPFPPFVVQAVNLVHTYPSDGTV
jgi:hypothetical protein